ncbi:MAG: helicase UvrD [Glaciihabitans sp.]|nr:helicase UvrD [Glaciihabitans sp.]
MAAGTSAEQESQRYLARADAHHLAAIADHEAAERYRIAAVTEKSVARTLSPLAAAGYHLLADRRWPGSRTAQVDLIVVGPTGVFIVDTKAWREVSIEGDRIFRGQDDVSDELANLADLGYGTAAAMAEIGLAPGEIHSVVALAGRSGINAHVGTVEVVGERDVLRHITKLSPRLTPSQVDLVVRSAMDHFPLLGAPVPVSVTIAEPVLAALAIGFDDSDLPTDEEVSSALLAGILAEPIEEWMSFLHPEQAKLVRRSFNGPSRIRGAAGTGKTVVALHRAAYLARSKPGSVLVTTYVRTLPAVLSSLLNRMAPDVSGRVIFTGVHAFASALLAERGVNVRVDRRASDLAFASAWKSIGEHGLLGRIDHNPRYWKEEVDSVIKGRGITTLEQYNELARTGRRRRLSLDQRREVWALYREYTAFMSKSGAHDFADLISLAASSLAETPLEGYCAVIVDEAQDLSSMMIKMLHSIVGNAPDGMTLVGDGQQTIYPGGYTLSEVGVSLAGRGVVMTTNYRNTKEIIEFAAGIVAGDEYTDIEGAAATGDDIQRVERSGETPSSTVFSSKRAHDAALVDRINSALREVGTNYGDIGVLSLFGYSVSDTLAVLHREGIPTIEMDKYTGAPINAVKVGTIKRSKGLEFKQVLVSRVPRTLVDATPRPPGSDDAWQETWELQRRELYVAMTRARDGLWIGAV